MRVEGAPSTRRPRHPLYESDRFDWSPYSSSRTFGFGELVSRSWGEAGRSGAVSRVGRKGGAGGVVRRGGGAEGSRGFHHRRGAKAFAGAKRRAVERCTACRQAVSVFLFFLHHLLRFGFDSHNLCLAALLLDSF